MLSIREVIMKTKAFLRVTDSIIFLSCFLFLISIDAGAFFFAPQSILMNDTPKDLDQMVKGVPAMENATNTPPKAGIMIGGAALDFQTADHRMVVSGFKDFPTTAVTVSLWMKSVHDKPAGILSYAVPGDHDNELLLFDQNKLEIFIGDKLLDTGIDFCDGKWHHVALSWQSSDGKIILYRDGIPVFTTTHQSGYSLIPGGMLVLAEEQDAPGDYDPNQAFIGQIDELRIWKHVRSGDEIRQDMNREIFGSHPRMSAYWKLNEGDGKVARDESPSGNHGLLENNTPWIIPGKFIDFIPTINVYTDEDTDTTVTLGGYDGDADSLKAYVSSLPGIGDLYQYGGPGPVKGAKIENPGTLVTDPDMRVIYSPENRAADYHTFFYWKVFDGLAYSDNPASVTLNAACDFDGDEPPILVDQNAPGPKHDGRSWKTAYTSIQEAIDDSDAAQLPIFIADGVYGDCIVMKSGRKLFGGFEGYGGAEETRLDQRNWKKNATIIDASIVPRPNHVVLMESLTETALDGLVIRKGYARLSSNASIPENKGGGIYMISCDDTNRIENCTITDNESRICGGNIYSVSSDAVFRNCRILKGESIYRGAGVFLDKSDISFAKCEFSKNKSNSASCIYFAAGSDAIFENCVFSHNYAFSGIIYTLHVSPVFTNCTFSDSFLMSDLGQSGGVILALDTDATFRSCIFSGIPKLAVYELALDSDPVVENCLFHGNPDGDYYDENSTVLNGAAAINALINFTGSSNSGGIDGPPRFAARHIGDYHITACSAALDRGSSTTAPDADRDGNMRPVDLPGVGQDGPGKGYDIGAYELQQGPHLSLFPGAIHFPPWHVNQIPINAVEAVISNIGTDILQLNGFSTIPSGEFEIYHIDPVKNMDPCTSHSFFVAFDPSSPGFKTADLVADTNDPDSMKKTITLSGMGINAIPMAGKKVKTGDVIFTDPSHRMVVTDYNDFPSSNITVSFWLKPGEPNDAGLFSYAVGSGNDANEFLVYNQNNIQIFIREQSWISGVSFNDGTWHQLTVSWRSFDGEVRLYKDGTFATSSTLKAGYMLHGSGTLVLSEDQDDPGGGFDPDQAFMGSMAEVRVWNVARSGEQIAIDWKRSLAGNTPGLVGCWRFGEDTGNIVLDSSPSKNHGTLINGASRVKPGTSPLEGLVTEFYLTLDDDAATTPAVPYWDADYDICTVTVGRLPVHGTLYQYEGPGRPWGAKIEVPGTVITSPLGMAIYVPPSKAGSYSDTFDWTAHDGFVCSENTAQCNIEVQIPTPQVWMMY